MYNMNEKAVKSNPLDGLSQKDQMVNRDSRIISLHTYCRKPP